MGNLNETTRKTLYVLLTVVMIVSLVIAGAIVAVDLVDLWRADSVSNEVRQLYRPGASGGWLSALIGSASAEEEVPDGLQEEPLAPVELPDVQEDFLLLYEENPDVIGWLTAGETIDLPVVQRDNEYYLNHNYFGEWDSNGTVFLNELNVFYPRDSILLIHGHNMRGGAMFGTLAKYEQADYAFAHALLTFLTLYEEETSYYVPVAAFHASMLEGEAGYFDVTPMNFDTEEAFQAHLDTALKRSAWTSPVDVNTQDELLMLLTCSYHHADGRFVLLCRRLREGETPEEMQLLFTQAAQGTGME